MMKLTKNLLFPFRSRRATGWSLACLPLIVVGWLHFTDQDTEAEPAPAAKASSVARSRSSSGVATSHFEVDSNQSGNVIGASGTESSDSTNGSLNASDVPENADARCLKFIAGEWEDDYQGKRYLTVASDGTGKMVVDLDGIGKKLFAARLSFDLEWTLADGQVTMKTLGGEPKSKVQLVLKLYGNEAQYKILELSADRMLLLDGDGKTQYDWRRPSSSGSGATSAASSK